MRRLLRRIRAEKLRMCRQRYRPTGQRGDERMDHRHLSQSGQPASVLGMDRITVGDEFDENGAHRMLNRNADMGQPLTRPQPPRRVASGTILSMQSG
jgi:hypothetical protein